MAAGLALMASGAVMWLVGYFVPSRVDWTAPPRGLASGRNRAGEVIARWVGPALVVVGALAALAGA